MGGFPNEKAPPPSYSSRQTVQSSIPGSSSSTFQSHFASVSLHQSDRIRFLQFSPEVIANLRPIITRAYKDGIQDERTYGGSHEFKLRSYPWTLDSIPARMLIKEICAYLYSLGWVLHQSVDLSRKQFDKDTLVFRKQPSPPPASLWFSMSFQRGDRMRLYSAPQELIAAFRGMLQNLNLLQSESWKDQQLEVFEFKCRGYPWMPSGEDTMKMRLLILRMLELLETYGWTLYASIDQSDGSGDTTSEADSWYLVKQADWKPGAPVFHK